MYFWECGTARFRSATRPVIWRKVFDFCSTRFPYMKKYIYIGGTRASREMQKRIEFLFLFIFFALAESNSILISRRARDI